MNSDSSQPVLDATTSIEGRNADGSLRLLTSNRSRTATMLGVMPFMFCDAVHEAKAHWWKFNLKQSRMHRDRWERSPPLGLYVPARPQSRTF